MNEPSSFTVCLTYPLTDRVFFVLVAILIWTYTGCPRIISTTPGHIFSRLIWIKLIRLIEKKLGEMFLIFKLRISNQRNFVFVIKRP